LAYENRTVEFNPMPALWQKNLEKKKNDEKEMGLSLAAEQNDPSPP
jgi:hypothetical protein